MRVALVDIDGTIVNTCGALKTYLAQFGKNFKPENVITYNFDGDIGVSKSDIFSAFKEPDLYKYLTLYDGVVSSLDELKKYCRVIAYTSMPDINNLQHKRKELCEWLGFDSVLIYDNNKPVLSGINVLFDDCLDVHDSWASCSNTRQYLINQTYNQKINNVYRSSLWEKVIRVENFSDAVTDYINYIKVTDKNK